MGACCSNEDEDPNSLHIGKEIDKTVEESMKVLKILLLGSGSSGKSTLFKQLKHIQKTSFETSTELCFSNKELIMTAIYENCVGAMVKLVEKCEEFYYKMESNSPNPKKQPRNPDDVDEKYFIDTTNKKIAMSLETVAKYHNADWYNSKISANELKKIGDSIQTLWRLKELREYTYKRRSVFSIGDNCEYFLNNCKAFFKPSYTPTFDDYLYVRIRTIGMKSMKYIWKYKLWHVFDVGGQRSERTKWYQYFEEVNAIVFVAALNGYCNVTFDDETTIAMHESIKVFNQIINDHAFKEVDFILLLNKNDLFERYIRDGLSLSLCFSREKQWQGEVWEGPDYNPNESDEKVEQAAPIAAGILPQHSPVVIQRDSQVGLLNPDSQSTDAKQFETFDVECIDTGNINSASYFNKCYRCALEFIQKQYRLQNSTHENKLFIHVTTATQRLTVQQVFEKLQQTVLDNYNLKGMY